MKAVWAVLATALSLTALAPASADETTFCNTFITTLPYTVTTQGHYCLDRNLSTAISSGNAITIATDFVLLDLNNFKLGGGAGGLATDAVGIYAFDHSNLTIRGGNIRGFAIGIAIDGTTSTSAQNITIESNVVDGNLKAGIVVGGKAVSIRNNQVYNTGGSTSANLYCPSTAGPSLGISTIPPSCTFRGNSYEISGNTLVNTFPRIGGTQASAIFGAPEAFASLVIQNRVIGVTNGGGTFEAIRAFGGVCRDNTVIDSANTAYNCTLVGINSDN